MLVNFFFCTACYYLLFNIPSSLIHMSMKRSILLPFYFVVISVFFLGKTYSQKNVNVDLLTGTANVSIPIYTVQRGDIAVPVGLAYRADGIAVEDYNMQVGLGWSLVAEASVTRVLKGFPDDLQYQGNASYSTIKGWLKTTTIGGLVENFSIANDNNANTCTDEVTDYSYMNTNFSDYYDTEPDIFMVSA